MKYTVTWTSTAIFQLAEIWNVALDKGDVSDAANLIDQVLSLDAHMKGESREGPHRILICRPLAIYYRVEPNDCMVTVYAVWRCIP